MNVEQVMETYKAELKNYKVGIKCPDSFVLHIAPLHGSGLYLGTLTAYDVNGLKSERAFPLASFMRIISELEALLKVNAGDQCTGKIFGFNPIPMVKDFLYKKKVHRLFFLEEQNVLTFLRTYTSPSRKAEREQNGTEVIVTFG